MEVAKILRQIATEVEGQGRPLEESAKLADFCGKSTISATGIHTRVIEEFEASTASPAGAHRWDE
jgi:hypothetical protein